MAVAQQMMSTMNQSLDAMRIPGAGNPMQKPHITYFVVINRAQAGPFTESQLEELVKEGRLAPDNLVWRSGMPAWKQAGEVPEINKLFILFSSK